MAIGRRDAAHKISVRGGRTQPGATPQAANPRSLCRATERSMSSGNIFHAGGQVVYVRPSKPEQARSNRVARSSQHVRSSTGRVLVSKTSGWKFDSSRTCHSDLDVAKWSKAAGCKPAGDSPHPFESDRRVQFMSP